jgi:hypothetical protein
MFSFLKRPICWVFGHNWDNGNIEKCVKYCFRCKYVSIPPLKRRKLPKVEYVPPMPPVKPPRPKPAEMSEWVSVKNKLPNFFKLVLVTDGNIIDFGQYTEGNEPLKSPPRWIASTVDFTNFITHWMPLPELPK